MEENKSELPKENSHAGNSQKKEQLELPVEVAHYIETLPEPQKETVKAMFVAMSIKRSSFRSPIPPPEILKGYSEIIPHGAERILTMAEEQSRHRITMESRTLKEEQRQSGIGQIFGFVLGFFGILATGFMAYTSHDTVAGIFGTSTIVGLVGVFVIGKKAQDQDLATKK